MLWGVEGVCGDGERCGERCGECCGELRERDRPRGESDAAMGVGDLDVDLCLDVRYDGGSDGLRSAAGLACEGDGELECDGDGCEVPRAGELWGGGFYFSMVLVRGMASADLF